jgi:hypothetical protein
VSPAESQQPSDDIRQDAESRGLKKPLITLLAPERIDMKVQQ